jgi:hypothetical protein
VVEDRLSTTADCSAVTGDSSSITAERSITIEDQSAMTEDCSALIDEFVKMLDQHSARLAVCPPPLHESVSAAQAVASSSFPYSAIRITGVA